MEELRATTGTLLPRATGRIINFTQTAKLATTRRHVPNSPGRILEQVATQTPTGGIGQAENWELAYTIHLNLPHSLLPPSGSGFKISTGHDPECRRWGIGRNGFCCVHGSGCLLT